MRLNQSNTKLTLTQIVVHTVLLGDNVQNLNR